MDALLSRLADLSPEKRALLLQRLADRHAGRHATASVTSTIVPASELGNEPFPLTELQQAYWVGRSSAFALGRVAAHCYVEFENGHLDVGRLSRAWQRLVARHGMLRAVIDAEGRQRILEHVRPYWIESIDLREATSEEVSGEIAELRARLSHQILATDQWPLFEIRALLLPDDRVRVGVSLDALIVDGWSMVLLFREWRRFYDDLDNAPSHFTLSFRDYVLALAAAEGSDGCQRAQTHWRSRIAALPSAPELPLDRSPDSLERPRFVRRHRRLSADAWLRLKQRAVGAGLTASSVLLTAYADVIAVWSLSPHFTLSVPNFNRLPLHSEVNDIVGEFASFTLLEADYRQSGPFADRGRRLQERLWEDLTHSDFGGVRVLRELARARGGESPPIVPVVFTSAPQDARNPSLTLPGAIGEMGELTYSINQTPQVWLDNHVAEHGGELLCDWDTVDDLFPARMPEDMLDAYFRHLERLAVDDAAWTEQWALTARRLVPAEALTIEASSQGRDLPLPHLLAHDLFLERAVEDPSRTAVITEARTLTYGELLVLSRQWARYLRRLGAEPDRPVAIVMAKGWEQIVAALAVLQAGSPYVPIDAAVPAERLHTLLAQSGARVALTQLALESVLPWPAGVRALSVDRDQLVAGESDRELEPLQSPDDIAYLLFTSGSTGVPKGAAIAHQGVVNALVETIREFSLTSEDRVLGLTALHHDMSIFDIFGVLGSGGTIVLPEPWGVRDPAHWAELMRRHRVTVWNSVPAMMEMLLEHADGRPGALPDSLRLAFLGGDWIPITLPDHLRRHCTPILVVSVGGPTETTLWNIWYPVEHVDPAWVSIPYGRPIANTRYYVLNEWLEPCPTWVPGEMCCAGVGVAKGYWGDEELTAAKFVTHPRTGERLYRTGDLGRRWPDGTLEFLGRVDLQVKIQGQRIEPGEIEAALLRHPHVRSAVVVVSSDAGRRRLVGYVVLDAPMEPEELKGFLRRHLPDYMVPAVVVSLDRLPLTSNGKIDRHALPAPDEASSASATAAPLGTLLAEVGRLVEDTLSVGHIDPTTSLLSVGASSIDMVRIGNQLERHFGHRPRMDQLFRLQTIERLAGYYEERLGPISHNTSIPVRADTSSAVQQLLASFTEVSDPAAREAFKESRPGVRRDLAATGAVALARPSQTEVLRERYDRRRSYRAFSLKPISLDCFGQFLSCVASLDLEGKPKYLYASPGGLYPTQVYVHVKRGRVEGLRCGFYYHDPTRHILVPTALDVEIDRTIHIPFINTPIFDEAAFSILLVSQLKAIGPSYGPRSLHFVTVESGVLAHLLECAAIEHGLGLCQIGSVDFERIRQHLGLDEGHVLVHSLLGGFVEHTSARVENDRDESSARAAKLLQRVRSLSPDDVKSLLEATRNG